MSLPAIDRAPQPTRMSLLERPVDLLGARSRRILIRVMARVKAARARGYEGARIRDVKSARFHARLVGDRRPESSPRP